MSQNCCLSVFFIWFGCGKPLAVIITDGAHNTKAVFVCVYCSQITLCGKTDRPTIEICRKLKAGGIFEQLRCMNIIASTADDGLICLIIALLLASLPRNYYCYL